MSSAKLLVNGKVMCMREGERTWLWTSAEIKQAFFRATNSLPIKTRYVSRHFRHSYLKAKVKIQGKLNMNIIFENDDIDAVQPKLSKSVYAWRNYSLPKLAHFLRHSVLPDCEHFAYRQWYLSMTQTSLIHFIENVTICVDKCCAFVCFLLQMSGKIVEFYKYVKW